MKHQTTPLLLATLLSTTSAWTYTYGFGFGSNPAYNNSGAPVFESGNQNPNYTKSVPFQLDGQDFMLRLNISSITPYGLDDFEPSDQVVNSVFRLSWPDASESLNETMRDAQDLSDDQEPRFCVSVVLGVFSASATNGYEDEDDGDCSGALGEKCVEAIKSSGYAPGVPCRGDIPEECRDDDFPTGGTGSASLLGRNGSSSSPFGFAYRAGAVTSEDQDVFLDRETERLNVLIFSGKGSTPVCIRMKDDHVDKSSPATAGAAGPWSGSVWYAIGGLMGVVAFLV